MSWVLQLASSLTAFSHALTRLTPFARELGIATECIPPELERRLGLTPFARELGIATAARSLRAACRFRVSLPSPVSWVLQPLVIRRVRLALIGLTSFARELGIATNVNAGSRIQLPSLTSFAGSGVF